ncbi:MAG: FtsQ-type POTRA domain-containing protein [bacterium]
MKRRSASTLIYFGERTRKKQLRARPKHVNKEKRTRAISRTMLGLLVLAIGGAGVWAYFTYRPFDIDRVQITGGGRFVSGQDVQQIVEENALGQNLVLLDAQNLEQVVAGSFLASRSVQVTKQLPELLKVAITERTPIALILPSSGEEFYFVDAEGFVLGLADKSATNLPVINYGQQVEVGKFVEPSAVSYYFDLIKALDEDGIAVSTISSYPRYTQFFTREDKQVLLNNNQSAKIQVKLFAKLMEAFKAEGKEVRKIDLRFDKVIVEFVHEID